MNLQELNEEIKSLNFSKDAKKIQNIIDQGDELLDINTFDNSAIEFMTTIVDYFLDQRDYVVVIKYLTRLLNYCKKHDKTEELAVFSYQLGMVHDLTSNYEQAQNAYANSLEYYEVLNDEKGAIKATIAYGSTCIIRGEVKKAITLFDESLRMLDEIHQNFYRAEILLNLGYAYFVRGNYDQSLSHYLKCLSWVDENDIEIVTNLKTHVGQLYMVRGEIDKALKSQLEATELCENINNNRLKGLTIANTASVYEKMGELYLATSTFEEAMELFKTENDIYNIAVTLSNLGSIYFRRGELDQSVKYLEKSLELQNKIGAKLHLGNTLNGIGENYYHKKEFDNAIYHQNRAMAAYLELEDTQNLVNPIFSLLRVALTISDDGLAESMYEMLKKYSDENPTNNKLELYEKMGNALLLKKHGRRKSLGLAEAIFDEVLNSVLVDHKMTILAMEQKCDLLLDELRDTNEEQKVLAEIEEIIDKLKVIALNQNSHSIQVEVMLLEAILNLLKGNILETELIYTEAEVITQNKGLTVLHQRVMLKRELFEKNMDQWEKLSTLDLSIRDKLRFSTVSGFLDASQKMLFNPLAEVQEVPQSLLVITDSGLMFFSFKFGDDVKVNDHLIAAFLTALDSFSKDAFVTKGSLQTIQHQDYTITMKPLNFPNQKLTFYYIYRNLSSDANEKLEKFIEYFNEIVPDLDEILKEDLIPVIKVNEEQTLDIKKIFMKE